MKFFENLMRLRAQGEGVQAIKGRIWMDISATECPYVVTTAFYSQAQWCLCAGRAQLAAQETSVLCEGPHLQKHRCLHTVHLFILGLYWEQATRCKSPGFCYFMADMTLKAELG